MLIRSLVAAGVLLLAVNGARGQESAAVREAAEFVIKRFAKEAAEESAESLAARIARFSAAHGEGAIEAVRKVGPRAFVLAEQAGEHAPKAIRLLARYGDEAAWIVGEPRRLALFAKHGDEAAAAMLKHKDIVMPLIERHPAEAARAFSSVNGRSARRLAMMKADGELAKIGRTDRVLAVVGRYGDKAADFVWRNKGALAVGAALTAFLSDPQPFIEGTRELAQIGGEVIKEPLREWSRNVNWTLVMLALTGAGLVTFRGRMRRRI